MTWADLVGLASVALVVLGCVGMVVDVKRHCRDVDHEEHFDELWDDGEVAPAMTVMSSGKSS